MSNFFVVGKFSPTDTTKAWSLTQPMTVYGDWPSAEAAAIQAQQNNTDGSSMCVFQAVATTGFVTPQIAVNLLGATVPTTT